MITSFQEFIVIAIENQIFVYNQDLSIVESVKFECVITEVISAES